MSVAIGLLVVSFLAALGAPFVTLLLSPRSLLPHLAWAYLLGSALWGTLLFAGSHLADLSLHTATLRPIMLCGAAAGICAECWQRWQRPLRHRLERRWITASAFGLGVFVWAGILAHAADPTFDTDGRITWTAHARYIQSEATVNALSFRQPRWAVAHPQYPPLMPLLQLTVLEVSADDTRAIKPLYATYWAALVIVIADGAQRLVGSRGAAASAFLAITLPFPALAKEGGAAGVYSDLPLAAFAGAALVLLVDARERRSGVAAGGLLAAAILTKNEGVILAIAALVGGAVALWSGWPRPLPWNRFLPALLGVVLAVAMLASWRAGIPNRLDEGYLDNFTFAALAGRVERLPVIARLVTLESLNLGAWFIAGPLLVLMLLSGFYAGMWKRKWTLGASTAMIVGLGSCLGAYLVTGWDLEDLVPVTWNRFLLQQMACALLLAAAAVQQLWPAGSSVETALLEECRADIAADRSHSLSKRLDQEKP